MDYNSKKIQKIQDITDVKVSAAAKGVYLYIVGKCKDGIECQLILKNILDELRVSENSFYKYVNELESANLIERTLRRNRPTIYKLVIDDDTPDNEDENDSTTKSVDINNNITNDLNTNDLYISIDPSEKYLTQNKYFTYHQKKAILKIAKGNVKDAREIERHIFGAKKTAIKNKMIDFKKIPLIAWINKISKYMTKANNKAKYLFNALTNEFKEYFNADKTIDTNKTYRQKAKKVIRPEWEKVEKKEIEEATQEEKEELLQKLADLRAGNYKTKEKEEKITEIKEDKNAKEKWLSKLEQLRCKNTPLKFS